MVTHELDVAVNLELRVQPEGPVAVIRELVPVLLSAAASVVAYLAMLGANSTLPDDSVEWRPQSVVASTPDPVASVESALVHPAGSVALQPEPVEQLPEQHLQSPVASHQHRELWSQLLVAMCPT